jgi:hypothetical protein
MEHGKDNDQVGLESEVDRVREATERSPSDSRLEILISAGIFRDPIIRNGLFACSSAVVKPWLDSTQRAAQQTTLDFVEHFAYRGLTLSPP